MSLTEAQKEFIAVSIDHLLDFPSSKIELKTKVIKLKQALEGDVNSDHEFFMLRKCLLHPTETLLGIEKYNDPKEQPISIGEVQIHIIDLCMQKIEETGSQGHALLEKFFPQLDLTIQNLIPKQNFQLYFITQPPRAENQFLPWENMQDAGNIVQSTLYLSPNGNIVLEAEVTLPDKSTKKCAELFKEILFTPTYDYFCSLIPDAKERARRLGKFAISEYLRQAKLISNYDYSLLMEHSLIDKLITHQFYLVSLLDKKINLYTLLSLSETLTNKLLEDTIINLLKNNLCTLADVLNLTTWEIKTITAYYSLLINKKIQIQEIYNINEDQSRILILPVIINLIKNEKINLSLAKNLPIEIKDLLNNHFYSDYFLKTNINWDKIFSISSNQIYDFLLNKQIIQLIANNILYIDDILTFIPQMLTTLRNPTLSYLLCQKKLILEEVENLTLKQITLIETNLDICEWLENSIIDFEKTKSKNLSQIYSEAYAERLIEIFNENPYRLQKQLDNPNRIKKEMRIFSQKYKFNEYELKEKTIEAFLQKIKNKINLIKTSDKKEIEIFQTLLSEINCNNSSYLKLFKLNQFAKNFSLENDHKKNNFISKYKSFLPGGLFKNKSQPSISTSQSLIKNIISFSEFVCPKSIFIKPNSIKKVRYNHR